MALFYNLKATLVAIERPIMTHNILYMMLYLFTDKVEELEQELTIYRLFQMENFWAANYGFTI